MVPPHRALVTLALPDEVKAVLDGAFHVEYAPEFDYGAADAHARIDGHDILIVSATKDRLDAAAIAALPGSVRVIATYSIGHEHIDLGAARARGIAVFATPDVLTDACAEVGLLLLLGAARRVTESIELIRGGGWTGWSPTQLNGVTLAGKRLGIIGMGRIGRAIALRAKAFGMVIHYTNRTRLDSALEDNATFHADAEALLRTVEFLLLACPATRETTGFLNARRLALMPRGAIVTNVGRGAVVADDDLIAALASGHIAAAGLDVFSGEPEVHPGYFALRNVFMLPHIGSSTIEARIAMGQLLVEGLRDFAQGRAASNRIA